MPKKLGIFAFLLFSAPKIVVEFCLDGILEPIRKQQLFWFSVWGHSWEFERDANWDLFDRFCDLAGVRADIWYATVIDVFDYLKAARESRCRARSRKIPQPGRYG
ncbi:MAG: hypothetical protein JXD23_00340 [Spirochaetales bacterium]|nr:hypothetical protein [Spirochaetales bacterium]